MKEHITSKRLKDLLIKIREYQKLMARKGDKDFLTREKGYTLVGRPKPLSKNFTSTHEPLPSST